MAEQDEFDEDIYWQADDEAQGFRKEIRKAKHWEEEEAAEAT